MFSWGWQLGYLWEMGAMCKQAGCRSGGWWPSFLCRLGSEPCTTPLYTHSTHTHSHQAVTVTCSPEKLITFPTFNKKGFLVNWREGWWWWWWGVFRPGCRPDTEPVYTLTQWPAAAPDVKITSVLGFEKGWLEGFGEKEKLNCPKEPDITQHAISGGYYDF